MEGCIESRKRVRGESSLDFLRSKIVRVDSIDLDVISSDVKDIPVGSVTLDAKFIDSEQIGIHADHSVLDSFQANAIQEDLLKILDEADASTDRDLAIQGLDSVIRSFEEEIHAPSTTVQPAIEVVSESGVSRPELGYLLEASDDELGLPPSGSPSKKEKIEVVDLATHHSSSNGMIGFLGLEEEVPSYCWFDSLSSEKELSQTEEGVALGGLFDHTDVTVGVEFPCRSETTYCL